MIEKKAFGSPFAARTMADIMFYLRGRKKKKNCDQKDCGLVALGDMEFIFPACWFLSRSPGPGPGTAHSFAVISSLPCNSTFLLCWLLPSAVTML